MQNLDLQSFSGTIAIVSPHMDDEALACGGLIAKLPDKNRIYIIYCTDGMKSPAPIIPGSGEVSLELDKVRMQEATEAMSVLGIPEQNLNFLCLPDAQLSKNMPALQRTLREKLEQFSPKHIFVPFRYDRSPDHLAVNHAVVSDIEQGVIQTQLVEYFVYHRWRLLPKRDIRKYVRLQFLYELDITDVAKQKRESLDCFVSQTTIYYPWQTRPILTPKLLDEECQYPEYFLIPNASLSGTAVFSNLVLWIQIAHRLEPVLLRWKYLFLSTLKRVFRSNV
jgi:LmbE family N-acetylglucosaminyl deacetylase